MFKIVKLPFMRLFLLSSVSVFAPQLMGNRISAIETRPLSCAIEHISEERLASINKKAQEEGCITEEERETLDKRHLISLCSDETLVAICSR